MFKEVYNRIRKDLINKPSVSYKLLTWGPSVKNLRNIQKFENTLFFYKKEMLLEKTKEKKVSISYIRLLLQISLTISITFYILDIGHLLSYYILL